MFDSVVLDIAIGLIFVFLATSLAITAGNELLASLFQWRSKDLSTGMRMLVGSDAADGKASTDLVRAIYQHPLIRGLHNDAPDPSGRNAPSYIPPNLFAMALLDIALRPADKTRPLVKDNIEQIRGTIAARRGELGDRVTEALLTFVNYAESDSRAALNHLEKLQHDVEGWFNAGMDRVSTIYKKRAQLFSLILAVSFCTALNLDSVRITRALSNDPVLRATLIERAKTVSEAEEKQTTVKAEEAKTEQAGTLSTDSDSMAMTRTAQAMSRMQDDVSTVTQLGIPLGWEGNAPRENGSSREHAIWWLSKIIGILLTALAASLGAPFWFDVLKKATNLRQAGKQPAR